MELDKIKNILEKEPDEAVEELLKEVKELYGEIPYILNFMKQSPELLATKVLYDDSIIREFKRMDKKTVELISIGVSSALRCKHCLKMHIRVAQRLGIPKEEIFDAILIAGSLSNAAVLAEGTRAMDSESSNTSSGNECDACVIPGEKGKQD